LVVELAKVIAQELLDPASKPSPLVATLEPSPLVVAAKVPSRLVACEFPEARASAHWVLQFPDWIECNRRSGR
jgi:hypothetical protein